MFEGKSFRFGDEEVSEDDAGETCGSPRMNNSETNLIKLTHAYVKCAPDKEHLDSQMGSLDTSRASR